MKYTKTFPELTEVKFQPSVEDTSFISSSESVGCGNEPSMNRLPKFSNGEFPNNESGEGKGDA
jgi:hypothetical protein